MPRSSGAASVRIDTSRFSSREPFACQRALSAVARVNRRIRPLRSDRLRRPRQCLQRGHRRLGCAIWGSAGWRSTYAKEVDRPARGRRAAGFSAEGGDIPPGRLNRLVENAETAMLRELRVCVLLALFLPPDTDEHYKCSEPLSSRSCFRWPLGRTSPCCAAPGVASTPLCERVPPQAFVHNAQSGR